MFYIMIYEEGRVFWDPALPKLGKTERAGYYRELIRVLAAIHSVDIDSVAWRGKTAKPWEFLKSRLLLNNMVNSAACQQSGTGTFTWPSVIFEWPPFARACINAVWMATRPT